MRYPDYSGGSLVNLVAQIEHGLRGDAPTPGLRPDLENHITPGTATVLLLIDGLGYDMVAERPEASPLRDHLRGRLDASFSTQTSVATATLATGLPPAQHGLLGYLLDLASAGGVTNTLWWMRTDGLEIDIERRHVLPRPILAERLAEHGIETTVVEPAGYLGSPLDDVLYRGARTRGVADLDELVDAVTGSSAPGCLVLGYVPHVDAAGHTDGLGSRSHREAIAAAARVWERLAAELPASTTLVGTADHGMVGATTRHDIEAPAGVRVGGDNRVLFLYGDPEACGEFATELPGEVVTRDRARPLWGPGPPHPEFDLRRPHLLVFAPAHTVFHHTGSPTRMAGYHGGITAEEIEIPLLVR